MCRNWGFIFACNLGILNFKSLTFKKKQNMSKMSYSESEPDSNFVINSLSTLSETESDDSESDFNSVFMSLDIYIFFTLYLHSSK